MNDSYNMTDIEELLDESELDQARYSMKVVSMVLYCITFLLGIPGNALVIWIAGVKMTKTVNTTWYVNLAVADLLCCLTTPFLMPFSWPYRMETFMTTVVDLNMFASVFTMTLISLDHVAVVVWPVWAQNQSMFRVRRLCGLAWLLALLLSLSRLIPKTFIPRAVFGFLTPLLVMTVCYLLIARRLSVRRFKSQKILQIMVGVVTAFFICWMPNYIVNLVVIYGKNNSTKVALTVAPLAFSLACFNSCLKPVLYVFMGQDFKDRSRVSLRLIFENAFKDINFSQGSHTEGELDTIIGSAGP